MDNNLQTKLIALKHSLQNDINTKYGVPVEVQLKQKHTKRLDTLVQVDIIGIQEGMPLVINSFDVYQDRRGIVYWERATNMQEDTREKPID